MREIKFRAWDREYPDRGMSYSDNWNNYDWGDLIEDQKRFAIMQYTGLKAKGKEIYEGDIIKVYWKEREEDEEDIEVVKWESAGYWLKGSVGYGMDYYPPLSEKEIVKEIIGNIYENKELLK